MAPRKPFQPADEDDDADDEALEELVDEFDEDDEDDDGDASEDDDDESLDLEADSLDVPAPPRNAEPEPAVEEDSDDENGDDEDSDDTVDEDAAPEPERRPRARTDPRRARGPGGGLGRPSTGPRRRHRSEPDEDSVSAAAETELAPDISAWPGTAEAAKLVGRHTSTLKAWRAQGRVSAIQDQTGCWRYNPDDLAEAMSEPEATNPADVLAHGMTAIVSQGASANERLLAMTEIATRGLEDATKVLSEELKRAYTKIADLERQLEAANDKLRGDRSAELLHDRYVRRLDHRHELALAGARESSERITGLLTMIGPIAASIVHRLVGNFAGAAAVDAASVGAIPPGSSPEGGVAATAATEPSPSGSSVVESSTPSSSSPQTPSASPLTAPGGDQRLVTIEARIADAMARLCFHIRKLDQPQFAGLRAMLPGPVADALDVIVKAENDQVVGKALAIVVQAAQGLSDLQFRALRPIAPADVAHVIAELREIFRSNEVVITPDNPR